MAQNKTMGNIIVKPFRTYNYKRNEVIDHRTGKKYNLKEFLNGKYIGTKD